MRVKITVTHNIVVRGRKEARSEALQHEFLEEFKELDATLPFMRGLNSLALGEQARKVIGQSGCGSGIFYFCMLQGSYGCYGCTLLSSPPLMARRRPDKGASPPNICLKQPDRSGPSLNDETLLDLANKRGLLKQTSNIAQTSNDATRIEEADSPIGRFGEAVLWSISIAMLHLTFDVLVEHQYAKKISWWEIITRSVQAFGG
jgi:hypothetical protein